MRRTQADHPFSHARQVIASFGVASLPEDSIASAERLIRAADEALYEAKRGGKNTVASYAPETILAQAQRDSPHTSPSLRVVHPRSSKPCRLS
jgi:predicted signal transduction protein with EAL and GGDEF domain